MISVPSVLNALFIFTILLLIVCFLYAFFPSLIKHGNAIIFLFVAAVATLRLILLFEIPNNHLVRSWNLLGWPVRFIRAHPVITIFLLMVWVAGAIRFAYKDIQSLRAARNTSNMYRLYDDAQTEHIKEIAKQFNISHPIMVSPDVDMAYVEGIFHHTIYLPVLYIPDNEIGFVLRHEAQHIRNRDSIIKFAFRILLLLMWWNPVVHWFWSILDNLLELRCDARLMRTMTAQERKEYEEMLRGMRDVLTGRNLLFSLGVNEFFSASREKFIDQRLEIIKRGTSEPPRAVSIVVWGLLVVLFCASYLVIFQPAGVPPIENFEDTLKIHYEEGYDDHNIGNGAYDAFILKGSDGRYQLFVDYIFSGYLTEDEIKSEPYCNYRVFEEGTQK